MALSIGHPGVPSLTKTFRVRGALKGRTRELEQSRGYRGGKGGEGGLEGAIGMSMAKVSFRI